MAHIERACRTCRYITTENKCPICGSTDLTENWSGFIIVVDPEKSELAKVMEVKMPGKYAVRIK